MDPQTNEMVHFAEKPDGYVSNLVNCGIYILNSDFFEHPAYESVVK